MSPPFVRYRDIMMDNARWSGFTFRGDDIIISAPPKCGTTWLQTICGLLIFQSEEFPQPLDIISPWFEQEIRSRSEVIADLERQTHRRFIKSHTPFDGLPFDERVLYLCIGRDPRDVAISFDNHMRNLDMKAFRVLREKSLGQNNSLPIGEMLPPTNFLSERNRFWRWVEMESPAGHSTASLAATLHHLTTFWEARMKPNVLLFHYGDLLVDLEGQMRRLATRLGLTIADHQWPNLIKAATFESMRRHYQQRGPNMSARLWRQPIRFFNRGTSGQWHSRLSLGDVRRYHLRVSTLIESDLSEWLHR